MKYKIEGELKDQQENNKTVNGESKINQKKEKFNVFKPRLT